MTTKQDVARWAEVLNGAINNVAQRVRQNKFNEMLQQGMQPKQSIRQVQQGTKFQPIPNAGIPYSPEVMQRGGMDVPNMVPQTTTTQPNMLQVLTQIVSQNPEMVPYAQPLIQNQYNTAMAAKAPWMEQGRGGLATNMVTGQQISNPMESVQQQPNDVKVGDVTRPNGHKIVTYMRPDKTTYEVDLGVERVNQTQAQIQKLDPSDIDLLAKQAVKYQLDPNQLSRFNKDLVFAKAAQLDPNFDAKIYPQRRKLRDEFFGQGATAARMAQMNALVSHTGDMYEASKALKNTDYPVINKALNLGIQQTGDPRVDAFLMPALASMTEMASLLKSGVGRASATEQEIGTWQKRITDAKSPEQFKAIANSIAHLMGGQTSAIQKRWKSGMGTTEPVSIFSDRTKQVLKEFGVDPDFIEQGMETAQQPKSMPTSRTKPLEEMTDAELDAYEKSLTGKK